MSSRSRVVICGAGIAGISAAYYLSRAGVGDVLLLDERPPLTLTSDQSTECYRNWWPDASMTALMNRSIDLMDQLAASSSNVFRMNRRGYVFVTGDEDGVLRMQEDATGIAKSGGGPLRIHRGLDANYVPSKPEGYLQGLDGADLLADRALLARHFPWISDSAVGALHVRRAGWLSTQQLGMHLLERARSGGVGYRRGRVAGVELRGGRVESASLADGERIECEIFINAAGPFFGHVGDMLELALPVVEEIHLKLVFEDHLRVVPREAPLLIWVDSQTLPWNVDERRLFEADSDLAWLLGSFPGGAHTRPEGSGPSANVLMLWDYRTKAIDPVFPVPLDDQYPEIVLRGLATMIPGLGAYVGRASRPRLDGGYYVRTRENRPLIGPTPVGGAYLLGAQSGFGIMSACAAGELLATHISGGPLPAYASAMSLSRYGDPSYIRDLGHLVSTGEL